MKMEGQTMTGNLSDVMKLVDPEQVTDERVRQIFEQLRQGFGKVLPAYRAKGLVDDPEWMGAYHSLIMNKFTPRNLDMKTLMLIEFGADVAARWEYCIVGAYQMCLAAAGITPEEVGKTIKLVCAMTGMSYLEAGFDVFSPEKRDQADFRRVLEPEEVTDGRIREMYEEVRGFFGMVPEIYRVKGLVDDPEWLHVFHSALMIYTRPEVLDLKTMHLICIVVLSVLQNRHAVQRHIDAALNAGAKPVEISEAIRGCYVNAAVYGTSAGFGIFGYPKE
ncbi:MAG: hypothetical protein GXP46_08815 [Deferribacteres bacterium]|nr:hypothetical protein [Deferribacteres bacterium]